MLSTRRHGLSAADACGPQLRRFPTAGPTGHADGYRFAATYTDEGQSGAAPFDPALPRAAAGTSWLKIKNASYSQAEGRHELFESRRNTYMRRGQPHGLDCGYAQTVIRADRHGSSETGRTIV
jgi:hypothetical protein